MAAVDTIELDPAARHVGRPSWTRRGAAILTWTGIRGGPNASLADSISPSSTAT